MYYDVMFSKDMYPLDLLLVIRYYSIGIGAYLVSGSRSGKKKRIRFDLDLSNPSKEEIDFDLVSEERKDQRERKRKEMTGSVLIRQRKANPNPKEEDGKGAVLPGYPPSSPPTVTLIVRGQRITRAAGRHILVTTGCRVSVRSGKGHRRPDRSTAARSA
jgi:hypothetical protein